MDTTSPDAENTASWGRRILALAVDWLACTLIVMFVIGPAGWSRDPLAGFYVTGVFLAESTLLTATMGGSFGKLMTRIRTWRVGADGVPVSPVKALLRQALVCLVIPPLVFRPDGRGLHDMAAGSRSTTLTPAPH